MMKGIIMRTICSSLPANGQTSHRQACPTRMARITTAGSSAVEKSEIITDVPSST